MSYTVLARRYRSQGFGEVVGQGAIARTLERAIEQDRVAHAYLFVGTRGVGKTSTARIFAKALNGGSPEVDKAIMSGQDTDVIEIDAASNSKVDETRELIANAIYKPLRGKYKIYIIDEVHMLSTAAFNALLKTLEEPPEHVKFILCTTETHKVPATIQSRCQRFDFRNLSVAEISEHLAQVCKGEKVKADEDALHAVARLANGSMRDALSLLDRLMAARSGKETITVSLLEGLLGLPARESIEGIVSALADSDAKGALELCDRLLAQGITMEQFLESAILRLRDLMLVCVCGEATGLVDLSGEARERVVEQSRGFDESGLVHMIALCESAQRMTKTSATPRAILDAVMVRLAMTEKIADVARLLEGGAVAEAKPPGSAKRATSKKA
ncbi:MAG: DNA polymerase III subunit gamma/tau [Phycisphaeraceae bacterium]|nr:DNA polymerase III subunit gamma/tau [Phycisphaerales bacterium]MCB9844170.1 DNA polymerase III subunit gamma/tau [Phycisphaeraceae bacterium]